MVDPTADEVASDEDIAACAPNTLVRSACTALCLAGFTTLLTGFQMVTSLRFRVPALQLSLYAMIVLGAATMYMGIRLYRMRDWAARGGAALGALLTLGMGAFLVFSFMNGLLSCITLAAAPLSLLAGIFSFLSIAPAARATQIRQRMQDAGIELGF